MRSSYCPVCGSTKVVRVEDGFRCEECGYSETPIGWEHPHSIRRYAERLQEEKEYLTSDKREKGVRKMSLVKTAGVREIFVDTEGDKVVLLVYTGTSGEAQKVLLNRSHVSDLIEALSDKAEEIKE